MIRKLMLAFATVTTAVVLAQTTTPQAPAQQTPEQRIAHRVEYLTTLLTLQPSQVTQISTIFADEYKASSALETSLQTARQAVRDAVTALSSDASIDKLTAAAAQLEGQMDSIHAKAQVKFLTVLTADQREKLAKFETDHQGAGGGGPGGPGPRAFAASR